MIVTIVLVEDIRGVSRAARRADPRRRARRGRRARGPARDRDGGAVARRAAHGEAQRDRAAPCRRRDAGLGERDRVRQDGHADEERDDRARRRHGQRTRVVQRLGLRAGRRGAARRWRRRSTVRCASELERALAAADRANNATVREAATADGSSQGDPTEGALLVAARKAGIERDVLDARLPRVGEVPFSSERKLMSTLHRDTEHDERIVGVHQGRARRAAGALHARARRRGRAPAHARAARARSSRSTRRWPDEALRTLGVAIRRLPADSPYATRAGLDASVEQDLVFAGLVGMIDPPRAEAHEPWRARRRAGIRPIMITGDHPRTAAVIARELGIATTRAPSPAPSSNA